MDKILNQIRKEVTPSKKEYQEINDLVSEVKKRISSIAKKRKYDIEVFVGGSIGKDTWLPGLHDIDFFIKFNYNKYSKNSEKISDYSEEMLLNCFDQVLRLHGSRDYFQTELKGYNLEFVPTLNIKKYSEAKNITDSSPLHVGWDEEKIKKNKSLTQEIRIAKKFFRAAKVYGAESYINGFSGHVIDILTIHYSNFKKLVEAIDGWEKGMIIDVEKHHSSREELMKKMSNSKLFGPLIVVDPIQPERNCAAALNIENLNKLKKHAAGFIKRPSLKFFESKKIDLDNLKKIAKKENKKLVYIEADAENENQDVAGSKIMKHFKYLLNHVILNDFEIIKSDWEWDKDIKNPFKIWFFTNKKDLPKKKILWGPPLDAKQEFINNFKSKHGAKNIKKKNKKYYVEVERIYQRIDQLIAELDNHEYFKAFSFRIYNG